MNRRAFFKTVAATAVGAVAAPAVVVTNGTDRSVKWGTAYSHIPRGEFWMAFRRPNSEGDINLFRVKATEEVVAGQALVWNPEGTVRGV